MTTWGLRLTIWDNMQLLLCETGWLELDRAVRLTMYPTREEAVKAGVEMALRRSEAGAYGDVGIVAYAMEEGGVDVHPG